MVRVGRREQGLRCLRMVAGRQGSVWGLVCGVAKCGKIHNNAGLLCCAWENRCTFLTFVWLRGQLLLEGQSSSPSSPGGLQGHGCIASYWKKGLVAPSEVATPLGCVMTDTVWRVVGSEGFPRLRLAGWGVPGHSGLH